MPSERSLENFRAPWQALCINPAVTALASAARINEACADMQQAKAAPKKQATAPDAGGGAPQVLHYGSVCMVLSTVLVMPAKGHRQRASLEPFHAWINRRLTTFLRGASRFLRCPHRHGSHLQRAAARFRTASARSRAAFQDTLLAAPMDVEALAAHGKRCQRSLSTLPSETG